MNGCQVGRTIQTCHRLGFVMKMIAPCLFAPGLLSGCTTSPKWTAERSGQADGVVLVSYDTADLAIPPISIKKANNIATRRCAMLGNTYIETQVNGAQHCSATDAAGACSLWRVKYEFQCAGNAVASRGFPWAAPAPNLQAASRR